MRLPQPHQSEHQRGPPNRAVPASGPAAWPRATPPIGSPPKGHRSRSASASTMAPVRAKSAAPARRRQRASERGSEGLDHDQHRAAVAAERQRPPQARTEPSEPGTEPSQQATAPPEPTDSPPQQRGGREGHHPESPRRQRQCEADSGHQRRDDDSTSAWQPTKDTGGRRARHCAEPICSRTALAARRPLPMQAGIPTPCSAAPARAKPG